MSGLSRAFSIAGFIENAITPSPIQRVIAAPALDQNGNQLTNANGNPILVALDQYVAIVEEHHDEMIVTQHPVETGSVISDHAYRLPANLRMRIGWTPTPVSGTITIFGVTLPTYSGLLTPDLDQSVDAAYLGGLYVNLLNLMAARSLFTIVTGKRTYTNMLIRSVDETTDEHTEHALIVTVEFIEIILVNTTTVQAPVNPDAQALPEQTTPNTPAGQQQLSSAPSYNPAASPV